MGYDVELDSKKEKNLKVFVPPYRTDILHQIDLVEDIAIAYGYENFIPEKIKFYTMGRRDHQEKFSENIRQIMVGYGFSEVMSLIMTNKRELFWKMNLKETDVVETENSVSEDYCVVRCWLLPSLMSFLEKNKTKGYPQNLFEIGKCIELNKKLNKNPYSYEKTKPYEKASEKEKLSFVTASSRTNFSLVKSTVEGLLDLLSLKYTLKELYHESFIEGRCAEILVDSKSIGFFGEIHPLVLENFDLNVPVTAFELDVSETYALNGKDFF